MKSQRKIIFNKKAFKCYRDKGFLKPYHEDRNGWFDLNINTEEIKEEILYEAIVLGDLNESVKNLSEIKKLAYSYNIKPLTKAIYRLENSQIDEISKNFRQYKDVIEKIDKTITKRNEIWS